MSGGKALHPTDATKEQIEESERKVRDLVNYLMKYDDPNFAEQLGKIENPKAILIMIQTEQKYERGTTIGTAMTAVGMFSPIAVVDMISAFLTEASREAILGRKIK